MKKDYLKLSMAVDEYPYLKSVDNILLLALRGEIGIYHWPGIFADVHLSVIGRLLDGEESFTALPWPNESWTTTGYHVKKDIPIVNVVRNERNAMVPFTEYEIPEKITWNINKLWVKIKEIETLRPKQKENNAESNPTISGQELLELFFAPLSWNMIKSWIEEYENRPHTKGSPWSISLVDAMEIKKQHKEYYDRKKK